jgi:hypothetical protein
VATGRVDQTKADPAQILTNVAVVALGQHQTRLGGDAGVAVGRGTATPAVTTRRPCACRKPHPGRSSVVSILVNDSAETVASMYGKPVDPAPAENSVLVAAVRGQG